MRAYIYLGALMVLCACSGYKTGSDVGIGFDAMNTQSKESKENDDWFSSFYGSKKCEPTLWSTYCKDDAGAGGGGGGGMWSGGVGPSDAGTSN
jgi:hypothetical protein